jgi:T5orf172 domain
MSMASSGIIYILTNSSEANTIKVGRTNNLPRRIKEHNSPSNVIGKWEEHWSIEVPDTKRAEAIALKSLSKWKVPERREQFRLKPKMAVEKISIGLAEWSDWGRKEKTRRELLVKRKREELTRKREVERQAREVEKTRQQNAELLESLRVFYPERKAEYERAKRVVAGMERIPYFWGFTDFYLPTLIALSIKLFGGSEGDWILSTFFLFFFGIGAVGFWWDKFKSWREVIASQPDTIQYFERLYPDGTPPTSLDHLRNI